VKKVIEYARVYLISPEAVAILAVSALFLDRPQDFESLGGAFVNGSTGVDAALFFAPIATAMLTYRWGDDILNPPNKSRLTEWPDYWRLRIRVWASLIFAGCGTMAWFSGYLLLTLGRAHAIGACLLVGAGAVLLVSTATVAVARIVIKEALAGV
jgi:hypothetical protein